jgi:hypothetical protein
MLELLRNLYYSLPVGLHNANLVRRNSEIWAKAGVLFIHIPKAAGTSINQALYGRFMGHVRASDIERWGTAELRSLPSFAITRNPWDRLVSAYRYSRRLHDVDWKAGPSVPAVVRKQIPDIHTFAAFVIEWLQYQNVSKMNLIYQPQSLFVCDHRGRVCIDHIGKFEDFAPTYLFIKEHLGPMPALPKTNRSGEPVDYKTFYTPELIDIVGELYSQDVRNFGYSFE